MDVLFQLTMEEVSNAYIKHLVKIVVEWFEENDSPKNVYELDSTWDAPVQRIFYDTITQYIEDHESKIAYRWEYEYLYVYRI